ncbi:MAG: zinc ABC transporter substrate-binding protein [Candidatus Dormiibacterota bacterium]
MRAGTSGFAIKLGIGGIGLLTTIASMAAMAQGVQASSSKIVAVGAENEYANVIGQIGGRYVSVSAVESNPNTDPHTFEASPAVAEVVSRASLVVQNGVGYDSYMNKIEAASPNPHRKVIVVLSLLGLPSDTKNPHLWYKPVTMPAVARAVAHDLADFDPAHASYFHSRASAFDKSLTPWLNDIAAVKKEFPHPTVAVTEPVGDYMLNAVGANILTPWSLQADIMNGVDPSPQDVSTEQNLFNQHHVKVFLYNQQVTDSLTASFLSLAKHDHIPVVGVYETMPTPGYDYQSWMLAEVNALKAALQHQKSTVSLLSK